MAIIESQVEKWFEDARVTTAVTILQREPDEARRNSNPVKFIQLRKPLGEIYSEAVSKPLNAKDEATRQKDMDAIRDLIEEIAEPITTDYWRVRIRTQQELWDDGTTIHTEQEGEGENESLLYKGGKVGTTRSRSRFLV